MYATEFGISKCPKAYSIINVIILIINVINTYYKCK